jgi:hypothetical protein
MFGKKPTRQRDVQAGELPGRFEQNERIGKDISARVANLKNVAREDLAHEVFMLFREAKHQSQVVRGPIKDRTPHEDEPRGTSEGDRATYLAEETAKALRDHVTNPQTFFQVLSEQSPDVHFTMPQHDAVSMIAAMLREQRLDGILEGLRLAGLLNEPSKRRWTPPTGKDQPG